MFLYDLGLKCGVNYLFYILWWMYLFQYKRTESWTEKKNIYSCFYKRHHGAFFNSTFVPEAKLLMLFFNPAALILAGTVTVVTLTLLLHHYILHSVCPMDKGVSSFLFINSDFPFVVVTLKCNILCSPVWFMSF